MTDQNRAKDVALRVQDLVKRISDAYAKTRKDLALSSGADPETHVQYRSGRRRPDDRALLGFELALQEQIATLQSLQVQVRDCRAEISGTGVLRKRETKADHEAQADRDPSECGLTSPTRAVVHAPQPHLQPATAPLTPLELLREGCRRVMEGPDGGDHGESIRWYKAAAEGAWGAYQADENRGEQHALIFTAAVDAAALALRTPSAKDVLEDPHFDVVEQSVRSIVVAGLYRPGRAFYDADGRPTAELRQLLESE